MSTDEIAVKAVPKPEREQGKSGETSGRIRFRRWKNRLAHAVFLMATLVGVVVLAVLLADVFRKGWSWIDADFFNRFASRIPERAGIKAALWGSLWLISITAPLTFLFGVATAIYLEEYAKKGWLSRFIRLNISNLAGVPSIVYGILGLTLFVRWLAFGQSVLAGALTLTLLVLPIDRMPRRRSPPCPNRCAASYAMGATRWQTIQKVVLPTPFRILTDDFGPLPRRREVAIMVGRSRSSPSRREASLTGLPRAHSDLEPDEPAQSGISRTAAAGIIVFRGPLVDERSAIYLRNKFQRRCKEEIRRGSNGDRGSQPDLLRGKHALKDISMSEKTARGADRSSG